MVMVEKHVKCLLFFLSAAFCTYAQSQPNVDVLITSGQITLIPAVKLGVDPKINKSGGAIPAITYNTSPFQFSTRKINRILPPVRFVEKDLDTSYNPNYARIGGGNYGHKLAELYLANRATPKYAYSLSALHLSADQIRSIRDFSDNKILLDGARFYNRASLGVHFGYFRDVNNYFAKDSAFEISDSLYKRIGNTVHFSGKYDLKKQGKKAGAFGLFELYNYHNNLNQSETEYTFGGGWDIDFRNFGTFGEIKLSNLKYRQKFQTVDQWFLDINPRVKFTNPKNQVEAIVGVNSTVLFSNGDVSPFIFPYINAEKKLEGLQMKIYGGIGGGLKRNSIRRFSAMSPFFYDSIQIENTIEDISGFVGLKGRITENSQFNVEFGSKSLTPMPLFVTNPDSLNSLQIVSDDFNIIYLAGDVRFSIGEKIHLSLGGRFNEYSGNTTEAEAWHMPNTTYQFNAFYNINNQLLVNLGVEGMGKRFNKILNGGANNIELKPYSDIHLRLDYKVGGKFRIWLLGANLLNQNYETFYLYRNYGITIMGGLAASL